MYLITGCCLTCWSHYIPQNITCILLSQQNPNFTELKKKIQRLKEINSWYTEGSQDSENTLYDARMMPICHPPKLKECTTPRVNLNANYGVWVVVMCQCMFTNGNKCPTLVGMFVVEEAVHVQVQGNMGNLCTFLSILL